MIANRRASSWLLPLVIMGLVWVLMRHTPQDGRFLLYRSLGILVVYACARPERWSLIALIPLAGALLLMRSLVVAPGNPPGFASIVGYLGYAALLLLSVSAARLSGQARHARVGVVAAALAVPLGLITSELALALAAPWFPATFDSTLHQVDRALGPDPNALVGGWLNRSRALLEACRIIYEALALELALVVALSLRKQQAGRFILGIGSAALLGFLLYQVVPATGPAFVDAGGRVEAAAPRNAMPSLHLAWSLLGLWGLSRIHRGLLPLGLMWVVGTFLATLGSGQHYLIDLIVAFPFALGIIGLSERRTVPFAVGSTLVAGWLIILRYAGPALAGSSRLTLGLVILTAVACVVAWVVSRWQPDRSVVPHRTTLLRPES